MNTVPCIRLGTLDDAVQLARIFHDTVHRINIHDYTQEQVNAWAPGAPDAEKWKARMQEHLTFVADINGTIAGFGELDERGFIGCFYCHHDHQRQGVGRAIYVAIEQRARSQKLQRLFTEASITALPFFRAQGFDVIREQTVVVRGVSMNNFQMEKILSPENCV